MTTQRGLYTTGEVGVIIKKSKQTVVNWDKQSDSLEARGLPRLIPRPKRVDGIRYWDEEQLVEIKEFSKSIVYGVMAEFNRTKWGKRSKNKPRE